MGEDIRAMAREMRRATEDLKAAKRVAALLTAQSVRRKAVEMSSGTASTADQRRADHPYATRHGSPLWDLLPINAQTGLFRDSWAIEVRTASDGSILYVVSNGSKVGDWLQSGTRTMFARPLDVLLQDFAAKEWERFSAPLAERAIGIVFQR